MTFLGIGLATKHQAPAVPAVPDLYPDPPWTDDLTDADSLGWAAPSAVNAPVFGAGGVTWTIENGEFAPIGPLGALTEHGGSSQDIDCAIRGTSSPAAGAASYLLAARVDPAFAGNGYSAQLIYDEPTDSWSVAVVRLSAWAIAATLATVPLASATAWGGVRLVTEVVGSDTRLQVFVWHPVDNLWQAAIDTTDPDASDDDSAGVPIVLCGSTGGQSVFSLTRYDGDIL